MNVVKLYNLSQWMWMPFLKHVWFKFLLTILNMVNLAMDDTHRHDNLLPPSSFVDLLQVSKELWNICRHQIKKTLNKTCTSLFLWFLVQIETNPIAGGNYNHQGEPTQPKGIQEIMPIWGLTVQVTTKSLWLTLRSLTHQTKSNSLITSW